MDRHQLVFTNASVFDGCDGQLQRNLNISVADGLIDSVAAAPVPVRDGEERIDLQGKTLMPGLIDAHFHCNSPSFNIASVDKMHSSYLAQFARQYLEDSLLRGFTTVRDAGGADRGLVQGIESGLIKGPRVLISGRALSQTGGHGDMRPGDEQQLCGCGYRGSLSAVVDGADQMRKAVREQLRQGAHQIKIFVSGGVLSPTDPIWMNQFCDDEIRAAVEEAATRRTYVMAHAHTAEAVYRCAKNGVRSIEHGTLTDPKTAEFVAEKGAFVVPTLTVIDGLLNGPVELPKAAQEKLKSVSDQAFQAVEYCQAAGVKLGLGTDLFGELHGMEAQELVLRGQISGAVEALRSATSVNAELINMKDQLGVIKAGAIADLIVVDGDPLGDINVLTQPTEKMPFIMQAGAIVKNTLGSNKPQQADKV